jgi:hypothetical protein
MSPHSKTCVSDCPTGFRKIDGECLGNPETIATIKFYHDPEGDSYWSHYYEDTLDNGVKYGWDITVYGGDYSHSEESDPYSHTDRGVYLNGYNKFLTIQTLKLSSDFSLSTWIKP